MQTMTDVREAVRAANGQFEARFAAKDAGGIAALYTDSALVMPPGAEVVSGAGAIREFWQNVINTGLTRATLETIDLETLGDDAAVEVGRYTLFANDNVADQGKYLVEWKTDRTGNWRLHRDIWNSNAAR